MPMIHGLVFLEPLGLLGLLAPLALVLASLRRRPVPTAYLGTLRFFERDSGETSDTRERRIAPWLLAAIVALVLAALALARPGVAPVPPDGVLVTLTVDRSPSMFLPLRAGADPSVSGDPEERRIDAAFASFRSWAMDYQRQMGDSVFVSLTGAVSGEAVPLEEARVPAVPRLDELEPLWAAHDEPGAVWITDGQSNLPDREHAGLFASGGPRVPGPVSLGAEGSFVLDADGAVRVDAKVRFDGELLVKGGLPAEILALAELWAAERGLAVTRTPSSKVLLVLEGADQATSETRTDGVSTTEVGRDGWEARVRGVGKTGGGTLAPWLVGPLGARWIEASPGLVSVHIHRIVEGPSDPAAFAVSLVRLFDQSKLVPSGVVAAEERAAAGTAISDAPLALPAFVRDSERAAADGASAPAPGGEPAAEELGALLRSLLAAGAGLATVASLFLLARATTRT